MSAQVKEGGVTPALKTCSNPECPCENPQPVNAFSRRATSKDRLQYRCKTCAKSIMIGRTKNGERLREAIGSHKTCSNSRCSQRNPQPVSNFGPNNYSKDGYKSHCNSCRKASYMADKDSILAKQRGYNERNRTKISIRKKGYRQRNLERIMRKNKTYYEANKDRLNKQKRGYYRRNHSARREQAAEYRMKNAEIIKAQNKVYRQKYKTRLSSRAREWYQRDKEKYRLRHQTWRRQNKERCKILSNRYRARKLNASGTFTEIHLNWKLELQGGLCYYCREELGAFHIEHKIPLSKGGTEWPANICLACPSCNRRKSDKSFWEFLTELKF